jgi:uncharacterized membrane protein
MDPEFRKNPDPTPSFEETELTRAEYITAIIHFYRGELHRSTEWRLRLDNTTNWAIISVMALITFSLGDPAHSHVGILAGMALVFTFLTIEARRFRFFDVWRSRTRLLEENFIGPIVRRDLRSPIQDWGKLIANDLIWPKFRISWHQAMKARLLRNYFPLFILLLLSWVLKITAMTGTASHSQELCFVTKADSSNLAIVVSSYGSLIFVIGLYAYLIGLVLLAPRTRAAEDEYWQPSNQHFETLPELDT